MSDDAKAVLSGYWGLFPGMRVSFKNRESRLTARTRAALNELIEAGLVEREEGRDGDETFTLTAAGSDAPRQQSVAWMEAHGRFPATEPIPTPPAGR